MTDSDKAMTVLHQTVGTVEKEIIETNAVIDWRRDNSFNTLEDILSTIGGKSSIGLVDALGQHAFLACVDVISRDVSKAKVYLYERLPNGGKRKVEPEEHWLAGMLMADPNEEHNWKEFWEMMTIHLVSSRNAYVAKDMKINGDIRELIPVIPQRVTVRHQLKTYEKYFEVNRMTLFEEAMLRRFGSFISTEQMIHVRSRVVDGLYGYSTLTAGADSIRLAKAIDDYQKRIYDNDGQARVAVQQDAGMRELSPEAFTRLKQEIRAAAKKMFSNGEAMLLEPGYKAQILAMTAADMRVAEMHDAMINVVARTMGVPPHKIGHVADEKYSNMEVMERTYAHDVLIPIAETFERAFERSLLTMKERQRYMLQFDRKAFEIIDFAVRSKALQVLADRGGITVDELRAEYGMNPLPNGAGNVRVMQSTMVMLDGDSNEIVIAAGGQGEPEEPDEQDTPEDGEDGAEKKLRLVASK